MRSMACSELKNFVASWRKELVGLAVLVGVVSLVLLVLWLFGQITFVEQEVTIVKIITGLLVLVGMYWTSRRVLAAEKTVRVAEEGQITERFTRAIAQLGEKEMAIRLGGIYALERIAKDSEKDHGPIMEVLTAYVRERAPRPEEDTPEESKLPTTDIQAILTVIARRETTGNDTPLKLTLTQLVGANLSGAKLVGANLSGANLKFASLSGANLSLASLNGADLVGAKLVGANLSGASLDFAKLVGANLVRANLSGANLVGANLSGAKLVGANLSGANLQFADLSGANLQFADLSGATNLAAEQVRSADNWREAILPDDLQYLLTEPPA